eukprot:Pgem_evm1s12746
MLKNQRHGQWIINRRICKFVMEKISETIQTSELDDLEKSSNGIYDQVPTSNSYANEAEEVEDEVGEVDEVKDKVGEVEDEVDDNVIVCVDHIDLPYEQSYLTTNKESKYISNINYNKCNKTIINIKCAKPNSYAVGGN